MFLGLLPLHGCVAQDMPAASTFTVNSPAGVVGYPGNTTCETVPGNGV